MQSIQIDITKIIEDARAEKEAQIKGVKRLEEINAEIRKLAKERDEIRDSMMKNGLYMPKWQSDLLTTVSDLIEQQSSQ